MFSIFSDSFFYVQLITNLIVWIFRKQRLTAPLEIQNCSCNLVYTMYTGKTETFMAAVRCNRFIRIFHICPLRNWKTTQESDWVKVFANKTSHYVASWYRQPGGTDEDFQLDHNRNQHKGKKAPLGSCLKGFQL